jgi:hypothetical protein
MLAGKSVRRRSSSIGYVHSIAVRLRQLIWVLIRGRVGIVGLGGPIGGGRSRRVHGLTVVIDGVVIVVRLRGLGNGMGVSRGVEWHGSGLADTCQGSYMRDTPRLAQVPHRVELIFGASQCLTRQAWRPEPACDSGSNPNPAVTSPSSGSPYSLDTTCARHCD